MNCPKCKADIQYLSYEHKTIVSGDFSLDAQGDPQMEECDRHDVNEPDLKFYCPECFAIITTDEDEAIKFIKGDKKWNA